MDLIKKALISAVLMAFIPSLLIADSPPMVTGTAPFGSLTEAERDYYGKSFSYALNNLKDDQVYDWRTNTAEGQIRLGTVFKNKSGQPCRGFSEIYEIQGVNGSHTGYGCKRDGRDGWCKLKKGNMMSCALEPPDGWIEQAVEGVGTAKNTMRVWDSNKGAYVNRASGGNSGGGASIGGIVGGVAESIGNAVDAPGMDNIEGPSDEMKEKAKPSNAVKWWN